MNTKEGLPETDARGFSTEAGIAFSFDAAATNDGLATEAGSVVTAFGFGVEFWSPPGDEAEAGGTSDDFAAFPTAPVVCTVLGTTAPLADVVEAGDPPMLVLSFAGLEETAAGVEDPKGPLFCDVDPPPDPAVSEGCVPSELEVGLGSDSRLVPVATTVTDSGATAEDAGSAACVVVTPAPLAAVVETAPFTIVLVFSEPSSTDLVLDAETPEVASPPGGEELPVALAEVSVLSPGTGADEPPTDVVVSGVPSADTLTPGT